MRRAVQTIGGCILAVVFAATHAWAAHTNFKATLNGQQAVPAVVTTATGTGAFTLTNAGGLVYSITVNGLSGAITGAHFHLGAAGASGSVVQSITFTGSSASGTWSSIPDSLIAALFAGRLYVNVHTAANPGGEIRGQVTLSSGTALTANLEGSQENPAVTTSARGSATLSLSSVGGTALSYAVTVNGLSGAITGAHFHAGAVGVNGSVAKNILSDFVGNTAVGVWRTTGTGALAESTIVQLLTGGLYLNVHTAANPGGEIRGQVLVNAGIGLSAAMDSAQQVPPNNSTAKGTASFVLTEYGLVYSITVNGLSGAISGAHFHNAAAGVNGPVVRTLTFVNNTAVGVWKSNDAQPLSAPLLRELLAGNIYVNVHTATFPGGEIRGQVVLKNGAGATARYTSQAEVPSLTNTATGTASLVVTPTGVAYNITVNGLSGAITGAHFHRAAMGVNGSVVRSITSTFNGNSAVGVWGTSDATQPFVDSLRNALFAGQLYLNIHTAANPGGEIRGQVLPDAGAGLRAIMTDKQQNPPLTNTASGVGSFALTRSGLVYRISVNGLSGSITGAHFHLGYAGANGPVVYDIGPTANGTNFTGLWPTASMADSLVVALMTGRIYVNVHTAANPGGEVRGQLLPSEGTGFTAQFTGGQEVPPNSSTASGTGVLTVTDAGVTFHATVAGLSAALSAGHFHNAALGANGPVVRTTPYTANTTIGLWRSTDGESFSNTLMRELLANNLYLNAHTSAFPGGEIRGQVVGGNIIISSVNPISTTAPDEFTLSQNYPNPFNPSTTIRFTVPANVGAGPAGTTLAGRHALSLLVFDVLGREVATLVNESMPSGTYEVKWQASGVSSGVYFYKLKAGGFEQTKRMLLMK
ncbi:MAG: CHRD domain-containing protein [Ignavibacteriae bacterium]|nr:CHRD domain-containing protein [Ignavibacteriota bacterium]